MKYPEVQNKKKKGGGFRIALKLFPSKLSFRVMCNFILCLKPKKVNLEDWQGFFLFAFNLGKGKSCYHQK